MPFKLTPAAIDTVTAGTAAGVVTVTSTTNFYPGARVWLSGAEYIIVSILTATTMTLRRITAMDGGARYGYSDLSGITGAINQEPFQVVDVELSNLEKLPRP